MQQPDSSIPKDACGSPRRSLTEEQLAQLERELVSLAVRIQQATYRQLCIIRELDAHGELGARGFRSCAHYLNWRIGLDLGAAREKVRVAWAIERLPKVDAAFAAGRISYAKVRAITRVATPENEDVFLAMAEYGTATHVETTVRQYRRATAGDRVLAGRQHEGRYLQTYWDEDGMLVVSARIAPEAGAALMAALQKAMDEGTPADELSARSGAAASTAASKTAADLEPPRPTPSQRRADAIGLVARAAMDGMATGCDGDIPTVLVHVDAGVLGRPRSEDEGGERAPDVSAETSATTGGPCELGLAGHLSAAVQASMPDGWPWVASPDRVSAETSPAAYGRCEVEGAGGVSAETSRRLACDAVLRKVEHDARGLVIDIGRKRRGIPPGLRAALHERDGGCRFPGCGARRFVHGHHVEHWADGGETSLRNVVELCGFHHRLVHEGEWRIEGRPDGELRFIGPRGWLPAMPAVRPDADDHDRSIDGDAPSDMTCWNGDRVDYDYIIDLIVMRDQRARSAINRAEPVSGQ